MKIDCSDSELAGHEKRVDAWVALERFTQSQRTRANVALEILVVIFWSCALEEHFANLLFHLRLLFCWKLEQRLVYSFFFGLVF